MDMYVHDIETYMRGFNVGYDLKRHDDKLYNSLMNAFEKPSDYQQGVKDGAKEFDNERMRQNIRHHTENEYGNRNNANDNDMDRDR